MKKLFLALSLFIGISASADEGMWLLNMLDKLNLEQKGFKITAEQLYNVNQASVKDAVLGLGDSDNPFFFFCSSELISDQGLLMTNHHCGLHIIQQHATEGDNIIENGFWAQQFEDELPNEGLTASRMVYMLDVTDSIVPFVDYSADARAQAKLIDSLSGQIIEHAVKETHFDGSVKPFFNGNQYILFVYEVFKDVRLVGAPPASIGKFGGDTDNWMWPRHTGDFSLLRVYADEEGKPAEYSKKNKPYKPMHHFPVSLKGYKAEDPIFIMGFPGSTDRYMSSYGIEQTLDVANPASIKVRRAKLDVIEDFMSKDESVRIKYATKQAQISNYWKYFIGQNKGIRRLEVVDKKREAEQATIGQIMEKLHDSTYLSLYDSIKNAVEANEQLVFVRKNIIETAFAGSAEIFTVGWCFFDLLDALEDSPDNEELIQEKITEAKSELEAVFKEYDLTVEKALAVEVLELFRTNVDEQYWPDFMKQIDKKKKGDVEAYVDGLFKTSFMAEREQAMLFLQKPSAKKLRKDPAFALLSNWRSAYWSVMGVIKKNQAIVDRCNRMLFKAIPEVYPDSLMYPDANSTIRFTYGYVRGYAAADAVEYDYMTSTQGILEKEEPGDHEFDVPKKLKTLIKEADYGIYADSSGKMPVCFISNNDITGGNSGSPVLNSEGHLVGCAFDGNWEAMSGDLVFEDDLQFTISVDIRYILFVIDKYAGMKRLIDEMTIVH